MWPPLPASCSCWCDILIYGHLCRCGMCQSHYLTKQTPSSFDGRQAHWAALSSFIQGIDGDFLRVSDANDLPQLTSVKSIKTSPLCWREPPRTYVVREYRDYKCVVQYQAQFYRDVAFSYPKRPQSLESHCSKLLSPCDGSSTSPSNEPSLRVFRHCSTSRVFLL